MICSNARFGQKLTIKLFFSLLILAAGAGLSFLINNRLKSQVTTASKASLENSSLELMRQELSDGSGQFTFKYNGNSSQLSIKKHSKGAYVINANNLVCDPLDKNCDPEKYEVILPKVVSHIFGTGMQLSTNQAEVGDFLDENFGFGHCVSTSDNGTMEAWQSGACRMRTPILILPEQKMLMAYLQPQPKMVRLSRKGQYDCPQGSTCMVMKLRQGDEQSKSAPLVLIKKDNMDELYATYQKIRNDLGYKDKEPAFAAFGSNWETYSELGCGTSLESTNKAISKFRSYGIPLSTVTIGSGYWEGSNWPGCGTITDSSVTTDALSINKQRWGGLDAIQQFYTSLKSSGTVPLIGMRHRVHPYYESKDDKTKNETNVPRIEGLFSSKGYGGNNLFISKDTNNSSSKWLFHDDASSTEKYYMMKNDSNTIDTWVTLVKDYYGNVGGIKHDDMVIHNQKSYLNNSAAVNLPDNYYNPILDRYTNKYGKDFVIFTRDTWISMKGDAIVPDWLIETRSQYAPPTQAKDIYKQKFQFDNAITTAMSGYPTVQNNVLLLDYCTNGVCYGTDIEESKKINFLRSTQLSVFQGATMFSRTFDHLKNSEMEKSLIFYGQLRARLQQYAYDQAMISYRTGTLKSLRPLFFDYDDDPEVYKQYTQLTSTSDRSSPKNEFMFGDALLVRPVFSDGNSLKVYLPKGAWKPFIKTADPIVMNKGGYIDYVLGGSVSPYLDFPVFLKADQILLINKDTNDAKTMHAYVYFSSSSAKTAIYVYHDPLKAGRTVNLIATFDGQKAYVENHDTGTKTTMTLDSYGKNFYVANIYELVKEDSVAISKSTSVIVTSKPAQVVADNIVCSSWKNIFFGKCNNASTYETNAACMTANSSAAISYNVTNAQKVEYKQVPMVINCSSITNWSKATSSRIFNLNVGDNKVCARFSNKSSQVICGASIKRQVAPTCSSWTDIYFNGCNSEYPINPNCVTSRSTATLNTTMTSKMAYKVEFKKVDAKVNCSKLNDWSGAIVESPIAKSRQINLSSGVNKVCARFTGAAGVVQCGAMINKK